MTKKKKIIMAIDQYLLGDHNIDGTLLCDSMTGVGKSSPVYNKCDRKECTCYNPFRGRDFRSVFTKAFYKHLSVSEYRDATGEIRIGYVFSKDSNPNCINCRGAKGVCACNDNYRNALMLRDCISTTAVTYIYVLGRERDIYISNNYHLSYIPDLDMYVPYGSSIPIFIVPDGKTLWEFERKEKYIRQFRASIKIYSLSETMYDSLFKSPDDDIITAFITPMNIFTDDAKPFNREETNDTQELHQKLDKQLKIMEEVKIRQKREINSLLRQHVIKSSHVKQRIKQKLNDNGELEYIGVSGKTKKLKRITCITEVAQQQYHKWKNKREHDDDGVRKKKMLLIPFVEPGYTPGASKSPQYLPKSPDYAPGSP